MVDQEAILTRTAGRPPQCVKTAFGARLSAFGLLGGSVADI